MTELEYIKKIHTACSSCIDGSDLFGGTSDAVISACLSFLESKGYSFKKIDTTVVAKPINTDQDLIEHFYTLFKRYHPDMYIYRNRDVDLKLVSSLIEARQQADGLTRELAIKQCASIMQVIFEEEERFNFNMPITFSIFGQKNCGWITDVAVRILNERMKKAKAEEDFLFANAHAAKCDKPAGWLIEDIDKALAKLEGK
jgi:hypothetical protein